MSAPDDDDTGWSHTWRLVAAQIEDLVTPPPPGEYGPDYEAVASDIGSRGEEFAYRVLTDVAIVAARAVISLAGSRGEDPRATLEWLRTGQGTDATDPPPNP